MAELRLVQVGAGGTAGAGLGTLTFADDAITTTGDRATALLSTLRRHTRLDDIRLWDLLMERGWSNGQTMIIKG